MERRGCRSLRSSINKGEDLIDQHGRPETSPPRIDAAHEFVDRPDDERGFDQAFQIDADPARWTPRPEQGGSDDKDPQRGVRHLPDGDGAGLAISKEPLQKSTHRSTRALAERFTWTAPRESDAISFAGAWLEAAFAK